jgi:acyl-coenzyme A thioesterase PaaI-like protein
VENEHNPWVFGEAPLAEVADLAQELRELTSAVLALEQAPDEIRSLTAQIRETRARLAPSLPADPTPRIGDAPRPEQRVYVDHSRDVGDYNPCFPQYRLDCADDAAVGTVTFPVCYEGPPGIVHGGFLAVFFDCVLQQLNCDLGLAGKTTNLAVRYRRPTPLLTPLRVTATRTLDGDRIRSRAELLHDDELLCTAEMAAVAGNRAALPAVSPRRAS